MPQSRLQVNSATIFSPICFQGLPLRCLWGVSNFRDEAKGSSKMVDGSANENCLKKMQMNPFSQSKLFFKFQMPTPYMDCHFRGRTAFRVGRRIKFFRDASEALPWTHPWSLALPLNTFAGERGMDCLEWFYLYWRRQSIYIVNVHSQSKIAPAFRSPSLNYWRKSKM